MAGTVHLIVTRLVASPAIALLLLWLVGVNLRTVLLGVPPTLPTLHRSLSLSYSAAGLLTSVPVLMMAAGAVPARSSSAGLVSGARWLPA